MSEEKTLKRIKSGFFDRGLSLTKFALQSGASLAKNSIKGAFADADTRQTHFKGMMEIQARFLAQELGQLKGSLMKVGQMLAFYGEHFLPEEVVAALRTLHDQSISLNWHEIEKLLRQRLSPEQLSELEIDVRPLAAASMGQVHLATIKSTGELICLKIQYPGVNAAVDTDIKALRSILAMMRIVPLQQDGYEQLFQEIRDMLHQELDYDQERVFTEEAQQLFGSMLPFRVPRVFPRYSTPMILATSYEPGLNIDSSEVRQLSEERRSHLGEAFVRLFLKELFEFRMMQTDPHFGNYKVHIGEEISGDRLILLDWGAVRRFPVDFIAAYRKMVIGALRAQAALLIEAGQELGLLRPEDTDKMRTHFVELCYLVIEPWLPPRDPRVPAHLIDGKGCYMWSRSDLPTRATHMASRYALSFKMRPPPREILFLDRKIGGVFIVLKTLDARLPGFKVLEDETLSKWAEWKV